MTEHRRTSFVVLLVGVAGLVVLAVWLVPWDPVPGAALPDPDPSAYFTAAELRRGEDYQHTARLLSYGSLVVSLLVSLLLGLSRLGPAAVERLPRPWPVRVVLAVAGLTVFGRLVTLPFAVLFRRHAVDAGLAPDDWPGFARDLLVGQAVEIVVTAMGVLVLVGFVRWLPRAWPAAVGALLGLLVVGGSFVYPLFVEPLSNSFTPLPDGPLRTRILALAAQEGVPVDDVLVADASRRTTTLNAYVSGFGSTRRVVVYDNLVDDLPQDETLSVVAHELGHAQHDDVVTGTVLGAAGVVFGVGLLGLVVGDRRSRTWLADPRQVPRLLALVAVATLVAAPVENAVSRRIETRADVVALETTHDPAAFVAMQQELARRSLADVTSPGWLQWWFGTHPTTLERIALAERLGG